MRFLSFTLVRMEVSALLLTAVGLGCAVVGVALEGLPKTDAKRVLFVGELID